MSVGMKNYIHLSHGGKTVCFILDFKLYGLAKLATFGCVMLFPGVYSNFYKTFIGGGDIL